MTNRQPCPDHESLIQFSRGDLGGGSLVTLCDHVDSCPACQNLLDTIADSSTALTRQFVGISDHDLERARQAIEADLPTVQAVACSMSEMPPTATSNQGPTLSPPCELRQYHVMRLIAHGGMGEIYEAAHASLKRPVALKVIRRNRLDDPVTHRFFLQEIEVSGQLDHPNLVRAYDAWEQDGCLFLVQELLDGESLQTLARRGQFTTPSSILNILIPICYGVEALHARGLLHRDIKPANVMQLRNGTIKLVDFGLAIRPDTGGIAAHSRVGTIGYMSPEQDRGGTTVDERSDLFAVGCVVKDLLGQLPTHSWDQDEAQILQSLVNLTRQLLEENPDHRPRSVSEILRQLEHLPQPSPTSLGSGTSPSVASQPDGFLLREARARATFSKMSWAFLVQTNVVGLAL